MSEVLRFARPMNQQMRMWKTLACLVGAMTVTAALLTWIEPKGSSLRSFGSDVPVQSARSAIFENVSIKPGAWRTVEVFAIDPDADSSMLLAKNADSFSHFCVHADGSVSRTSAWLKQRHIGASPRAIRIMVAPAQEMNGKLSEAQNTTLRSLMDLLQDGSLGDDPDIP